MTNTIIIITPPIINPISNPVSPDDDLLILVEELALEELEELEELVIVGGADIHSHHDRLRHILQFTVAYFIQHG